MLAFIANFIVIVTLVYLFISLILMFCPNISKNMTLQKELEFMKSSCKTKSEYEIHKETLLEKYQDFKNVKINFDIEEKTNKVTISYFYKKTEMMNFYFIVKDDLKEQSNYVSEFINPIIDKCETFSDFQNLHTILIHQFLEEDKYKVVFNNKLQSNSLYVVTISIFYENNKVYQNTKIYNSQFKKDLK